MNGGRARISAADLERTRYCASCARVKVRAAKKRKTVSALKEKKMYVYIPLFLLYYIIYINK